MRSSSPFGQVSVNRPKDTKSQVSQCHKKPATSGPKPVARFQPDMDLSGLVRVGPGGFFSSRWNSPEEKLVFLAAGETPSPREKKETMGIIGKGPLLGRSFKVILLGHLASSVPKHTELCCEASYDRRRASIC